jgi:hypothetical protein
LYIVYGNLSLFCNLILKKLVRAAPSGLKCGTHIFYVRKVYLNGNVWIVSFPQLLGRMYPLICKTSRSIARKEMVLMAFDPNFYGDPRPVTVVTYTLTPIDRFSVAMQMHSLTFDSGCPVM